MAEAGAWENVRKYGLLSTTVLLDRLGVGEPKRSRIISVRREADITMNHPEFGRAVIRNQIPMPIGRLGPALTDLTTMQWCELLNGKVFFWPTECRLMRFLRANSHQNRTHDVLTVCTRSLIEQYRGTMWLSRINSGAVRDIRHRRGSNTFRKIADYQCNNRRECFAELAVDGSVPDIVSHTLSVDRWAGTIRQGNVWRR